jgi:hypothetical protein
MKKSVLAASTAFVALLSVTPALAATDADLQSLRQEIQSIKQTYEGRIVELENKLKTMEQSKPATSQASAPVGTDGSGRNTFDNSFNPSVGVILNGKYAAFSENASEPAGFAVGHEGERMKESLSVDHTEINFSAAVDDKFTGSMTAAIADHEGETEIELEEAYIQTLPGLGLPDGTTVKAGRALWTLGYLNEHHSHADDFADRPLPYRLFLDGAFNDDGIELSYVLPTDFYSEIGGGIFRGDDFPFGGSTNSDIGAWSAFARVGGDIGDNQSWRIGGYVLSGDAEGGRLTNEDFVTFIGDTDLYAADLRYTWAPTGNPQNQEVTLQGEYFRRNETGTYEDTDAGTGVVAFDDHTSGWYVQGVYKFHPQWRVGARYSQMEAADTPAGLAGSALDSSGHNPDALGLMADWSNSEFSRLRFQYNREELSAGANDNQFILQYIMSLGAHGAHKY